MQEGEQMQEVYTGDSLGSSEKKKNLQDFKAPSLTILIADLLTFLVQL